MRIQKIEIKNLGPFRGSNELDFNTQAGKPIVLIGGNNGSGKSTLLKLIKLGMHGHYAFGYKGKSNQYFDEIKNLINLQKKDDEDSEIKLTLKLDEDYRKNGYIIQRVWKTDDKRITEENKVYKNGIELNVEEIEEFASRLIYRVPLSLIEASFFDGEEVKNLVNNENSLSEFLKSNFNILFDIELFSLLENDLNKYVRNELLADKNSEENKKLLLEMDKLDNTKIEIQLLSNEHEGLSQHKEELLSTIAMLNDELSSLGRLDDVNKNNLIIELSELEKRKEEINKNIKLFLENEYTFYLNLNLIKDLNNKLSEEKGIKFSKYINEIINSNIVKNEEFNLQALKELLNPKQDDELTYSTYNIEKLIDEIIIEPKIHIQKTNYHELKEIYNRISNIKEKLEKNNRANEFVTKIDTIKSYKQRITEIDERLESLETQIQHLNEEYSYLQKNYDSFILKNKMNKRNNNAIDMAEQIIIASKRFRNTQISNIMIRVETECSRMFKKVIRKKNFIDTVSIDYETFQVRIIKNGKAEKFSFLSSGEQQILITSIIWAFFKLSNKKMYFIIDTPLARLDTINKFNYINDLLSNISNQVILLSTNSEVDKELYPKIKDKVYKEYTFVNDGMNTFINNNYFQFGGVE